MDLVPLQRHAVVLHHQPGLVPGNVDTSLGLCLYVHMFLLCHLVLNVLVSQGRNYISVNCRLTHSWYVVNSDFPTLLFSLHQEPLIGLLFPFWSIKALNEPLLLN